jgi:hypothetical protein
LGVLYARGKFVPQLVFRQIGSHPVGGSIFWGWQVCSSEKGLPEYDTTSERLAYDVPPLLRFGVFLWSGQALSGGKSFRVQIADPGMIARFARRSAAGQPKAAGIDGLAVTVD